MSRQQACCLLALAFFNIFKTGDTSGYTRDYQHFTLSGFLSFPFYASQEGKLLCILHYFQRIRQAEDDNETEFLDTFIQFTRKRIPKEAAEEVWGGCSTPLVSFETISEGLIEEAHGCLQVDFANEYIGGGVLGMGNVQVGTLKFIALSFALLTSMLYRRLYIPGLTIYISL